MASPPGNAEKMKKRPESHRSLLRHDRKHLLSYDRPADRRREGLILQLPIVWSSFFFDTFHFSSARSRHRSTHVANVYSFAAFISVWSWGSPSWRVDSTHSSVPPFLCRNVPVEIEQGQRSHQGSSPRSWRHHIYLPIVGIKSILGRHSSSSYQYSWSNGRDEAGTMVDAQLGLRICLPPSRRMNESWSCWSLFYE